METDPIRLKALLEILGKPKGYVEEKLKEYMEKIREDEQVVILNEDLKPAEEHKEGVFSVVVDIELVVKGVTNLVGFCIDYMPASIEIIKPEKFSFKERDFTTFVNDLLAKLHTVDMVAKQQGTENRILKENMTTMIKNNLLVLLRFGVTKADKLSQATGLAEEEIKRFLSGLQKDGRVKEEKGEYSLA